MKRFWIFFVIAATILFARCQFEYTPFGVRVPEEAKNLIQKNLNWLSTKSVPGPYFKVALMSDPQGNPYAFAETVERINARPDLHEFAFAVVLGDLTDLGSLEEYEKAYNALKLLDIPYFVVIGNHDALSMGKKIFAEMFGPLNSVFMDEKTLFSYSFEFQGSKFIMYNNNTYEFPQMPNYDWLAQEAAGSEARNHTFGMAHIAPEVDLMNATEIEWLKNFLADSGYGHSLHGHRHRFTYWEELGISFFIVDKIDSGKLHYGFLKVFDDHVEYYQCDNQQCIQANQ